MKVLAISRGSEGFYEKMGPIFGSRAIEKQTKDRFYDDAGKIWFLIEGKGAASVLDGVIRNFWADSAETAGALIDAALSGRARLSGIVPNTHDEVFKGKGFAVQAHSKNFSEVCYDEQD